MTYLEIVRSVARLAGTVDSRSIVTTQGATGTVGMIAELVQAAWTEIQNAYRAWRFLVVDIPEETLLEQGLNTFTAESLNLSNWSEWIPGSEDGQVPMSVWPVDRRGQETTLVPTDYRRFRQQYQYGSSVSDEQTGQPRVMAVDNQDRLVVWPTPDQDYRIAGTYRRLPQIFSGDTDVPIVSPEHHDAIIWQATLLVHRAEEADNAVLITTEQGALKRMASLRRRYLDAPKLSYRPLGSGRSGYVGPLSPPNPTFSS